MLCIIPARGGSKRIPGKNFKKFLGVRIISYPIEIAKQHGYEVVVSTDDLNIAGYAEGCGAIALARSQALAGDGVETEDVLYELLKYSKEKTACLMYPTSVFTKPEDLIEAERLLADYDLVYSIVRFSYPPQRALEIANGEVKMVAPDHRNSQDIPARYHDAAQFYMFDVMAFCDAWSRGKRLLELKAHGIEYASHEVQDIDTPEDWIEAEMKYKMRGR